LADSYQQNSYEERNIADLWIDGGSELTFSLIFSVDFVISRVRVCLPGLVLRIFSESVKAVTRRVV